MNRAEEQVMQAYPAERYSDRPRDYTQRWSNVPPEVPVVAPEMTSDPDWIREREIDREIQARDEQVDREFREYTEKPYETKRNSRIRSQLSYESPYEPPVEGEE